jgi:hypothetical protein
MIKLLELLNHTNLDIVFEIAWIFVFLTAKDDDSVKMLLDNGLVGILLEIICRNDIVDSIVIPIIRCLGNITSGQVEWIDMLFKYNSGVNMNYFFTKFLNIRNIPQPIVKETTWAELIAIAVVPLVWIAIAPVVSVMTFSAVAAVVPAFNVVAILGS